MVIYVVFPPEDFLVCNKSVDGATAGATLNGEQLTLNFLLPSICELIGFVPREFADTILDIALNGVIIENETVTDLYHTFTFEDVAEVTLSNLNQSSTQGVDVTVHITE